MIATAIGWISAIAWIGLIGFRAQFWRIEPPPPVREPGRWPSVAAVIPARDEAELIAEAVASLRAQDCPGALRIFVVDDQSSDATAERAREAGAEVIPGAERPPGWAGKVWAMEQGAKAVERSVPDAELILFADADIRHAPNELRRAAALMDSGQLDLVSRMVRLATINEAERAIVPAFVYFFRLLYPFARVNDPRDSTAAAAGGFMLIRRDMLAKIGGFEAIKGALIDDCALAAAVKRAGGRIRLDLADETASLRRYDWAGLWNMIARSAYTQLRYSSSLLALTVIALSLIFVAPPILALFGGHARGLGILSWVLMAVSYRPMLRYYRVSPFGAPLLPLVALFYLGATVDSARRYSRGRGGEWKGRVA